MSSDADPPRFDLQSHSTYSDGSLSPAEVVRAAAAAGVELLALTDHDTVDGVAEALAAGPEAGVRVVPAAEISARDREARRDLHILGYLLDTASTPLRETLERSRTARARRGEAMIAALRELGFEVDGAALAERVAAGRALGRPHLARAVAGRPENAARLRAEGIADASAFLEAYLIPGAPAFRPRQSPSVPEAIAAIHAAGGLAVWAHPFFDVENPAEVTAAIDRLAGHGLDGVECFYITHTRSQTLLAADHCTRRGLLTTGSADFHGPESARFNRFRAFSTYGRDPALGRIAAG
ncbi:MAG TPA: PHP domain-containing protein [Solirubrobacteraceae bacterium]|nr:PHP domain-containing protein [Solirubrobacteraceae bacterium]